MPQNDGGGGHEVTCSLNIPPSCQLPPWIEQSSLAGTYGHLRPRLWMRHREQSDSIRTKGQDIVIELSYMRVMASVATRCDNNKFKSRRNYMYLYH